MVWRTDRAEEPCATVEVVGPRSNAECGSAVLTDDEISARKAPDSVGPASGVGVGVCRAVGANVGDAAGGNLGHKNRAVLTDDGALRELEAVGEATQGHDLVWNQSRKTGSAKGISPTPTWLSGQFAAGWRSGDSRWPTPYHSRCFRCRKSHRPSRRSSRSS